MTMIGKPKNPLSSHNLFFQVTRKRILDGTDKLGLPITPEEVQAVVFAYKRQPKRKHRKTHGRISFRDLSAAVAQRWKLIRFHDRKVLEDQAKLERQNHQEQLKTWLNQTNPMSLEMSKETNAFQEAWPKCFQDGVDKFVLLSQAHCAEEAISSWVGSSHHEQPIPFQLETVEMISSTIFCEAAMAGIDLCQPIDSHEMDNVFL
jgi:hypothetical protein